VGYLDGVPVFVPNDGVVDALAALLPTHIDPRPVVGVAGDMLARYASYADHTRTRETAGGGVGRYREHDER
jgi:hypothetical protein